MTLSIKWLAFYLLLIPAFFLGTSGDMIIPDRKDVPKMSLLRALVTIFVIATPLLLVLLVLLFSIDK